MNLTEWQRDVLRRHEDHERLYANTWDQQIEGENQ